MSDTLPLHFVDDGKTVNVFVATDFRLHNRQANNPASLPRQLTKSTRNDKGGRAYTNDVRVSENGKEIQAFFPLPEKDIQKLEEFRKKGRKIKIRFLIQKNTPLYIDK